MNDSTRHPRNAGAQSPDSNGAPPESPAPSGSPDFDFGADERTAQPRPSEEQQRAQAPAVPPEAFEAMKQNLEAAYRRIDELARALQAGERDREEFKKRLSRERERMIDVEKGNVAQTLLETVDELDLSLVGADPESPLARGVKMIRDGIVNRLVTLGVERVDLVGRPFDPNLAEAVDMEITADPDEDQQVIQEMRPAYRMKDRVIRPGRVKVAKFVQPAQA